MARRTIAKDVPPVFHFLLFRHERGLLVLPPFRLWPPKRKEERSFGKYFLIYFMLWISAIDLLRMITDLCVPCNRQGGVWGDNLLMYNRVVRPFWQCEGELCSVLQIGITHQGSVYSWQWTDRDLGRLKFILSVVPHTKFSHQFSDKTLQVIKTHLSQEGLSIPASL